MLQAGPESGGLVVYYEIIVSKIAVARVTLQVAGQEDVE